MNDLEQRLLLALKNEQHAISAKSISDKTGLNYASVMSVLNKLAQEKKVELAKTENSFAQLTPEGENYAKFGLPERVLVGILKKGPIEFSKISANSNLSPAGSQIAFQWARKNGWVEIKKFDAKTMVVLLRDIPQTPLEELIQKIWQGKVNYRVDPEFELLKNRNLITVAYEKEFHVKITKIGLSELTNPPVQSITQLTPQMLKNGEWHDAKFREYDLNTIMAQNPAGFGKKHFYLQFIRDLKEQLVSLGFKEAQGPFTELEFWNMDALFMPQDHPARQIHDVFQLDLPEGKLPDKTIVGNVKKAHEKGVDGSIGWGYSWNPGLASRIALRSQTTSVSARTLASGINPPYKMFCIGKVFRPDEIDWKHFIEFNQCEGIVVDENMNFCELLGYLKTFAVDIFGARPSDVKFAPSYFPFTEPSVEMMVKINNKWTEVGGAGIFRSEMTRPLGCDVPVLAWGLGLDRLAMIKLEVKDIRDLFSQDLAYLRGK